MAERTIKELIKRRAACLTRRQNWESGWRDAYRFCLPQRDIMDQQRPGQPKGHLVYDSTAITSTQAFANRIVAAMFPPFQDHMILKPGPAIPDDRQQEAQKKLDEISEVYHAALHRSNFDIAIYEFILELAMGTGVMMMAANTIDDPFLFIPASIPSVILEPGKWGTVGGIYRDHADLTVDQIEKQWPDAKIPEDWRKASAAKPEETFTVHDATYFEEGSWYYDLWRDEIEESLLEKVRVYPRTSPWIAGRWAKAANEVYGRGPILYALPDIRTANRVVELILKNASLAVSGIYTGVNDGVFNPNTARFGPNSVIPVARNQGHPMGASLAPLERAGDFDVAQLVLEELRFSIKRALFDVDLPPDTGPVKSATEIVARLQRLVTDTGPAFGRLKEEVAVPIVMRGLDILKQFDLIDFPVEIDGTTIEVEITSPLAQQQNLSDVQNAVQWIELSAVLGPEIAMLGIKVEDWPEWLADKLNVETDLRRDPMERKQLMQMVAQIIAQAQLAQQDQGGEAPGGGEVVPMAGAAQ